MKSECCEADGRLIGYHMRPIEWHQYIYSRLIYSTAYHFSSVDSPLFLSITPSLFHSRLKTYRFQKIFPTVDSLRGLLPGPFLLSNSNLFL